MADLESMRFFDHFDELRERLMRSLYVFMAGFLFCYFVTNSWVMEWLRAPLFEHLPAESQKLYFTGLFENFLTHLKVAGYTALVIFSPYFVFQAWAFVAPGLLERERRWVRGFSVAGVIFFLLGAAFAYYVLFPIGFRYFLEFGSAAEVPLLTIDAYFSTCVRLMFFFGVAFELPVLIVFAGSVGLVTSLTLRENRKNAFIGITVASALFAPPDAVSMLLLMAPLAAFYEAALWCVQAIERRRGGVEPVH